jgi:hypothetical protein
LLRLPMATAPVAHDVRIAEHFDGIGLGIWS